MSLDKLNSDDYKIGIMKLCICMQLFQTIYCYFIKLFPESIFCFCSFLIQVILLLLYRTNKSVVLHLTCLNVVLVILSGNIHDSLNVNATFIFFSIPPIICIPLVGVRWGAFWTFFSIIVSFLLMLVGKDYYFGWGERTAELNYQIGLSNLITVPLLILGVFSYFFIKKQQAEKELTSLNNELKNITKDKERILDALVHDVGRNTSLLSGYIELYNNGKISKSELSNIYKFVGDIQNVLKGVLEPPNTPTKNVSIKALFDDLRVSFKSDLTSKGLKLIYKGKKDQEYYCNLIHLKVHILSNLLSNAIKFSEHERDILFIVDDNSIVVINEGKPFKSSVQYGTAGEKGSGYGLEIVKDYCYKNKISFSIKTDGVKTKAVLVFRET